MADTPPDPDHELDDETVEIKTRVYTEIEQNLGMARATCYQQITMGLDETSMDSMLQATYAFVELHHYLEPSITDIVKLGVEPRHTMRVRAYHGLLGSLINGLASAAGALTKSLNEDAPAHDYKVKMGVGRAFQRKLNTIYLQLSSRVEVTAKRLLDGGDEKTADAILNAWSEILQTSIK